MIPIFYHISPMETTGPNQKIYLNILFIIGIVYALFFSAFGSAIKVMYNSEVTNTNFLSFFRGVVALMAFTGILVSFNSTRGWLATTAIILLLLGSVTSVLAGHMFSYDTRTDAYLFYFISTTAATLIFILVFTILIKYLFAHAGGEVTKFLLVVAAGAVIGYLANFSFTLADAPAISLWYVILLLLLIVSYFFQKEKPVETQYK